MKRPGLFCLFIGLFYPGVHAQSLFHGILLNKSDSTGIANAAIKLIETNIYVLTGLNGAFDFTVPANLKELNFEISAIGLKAEINYKRTFAKIEKIYVNMVPDTLNEFVIGGLSAEEVVRKAIALIPANYADSSYFSYSSYRQYELVNGVFRNLVEAKPAVMFHLTKTKSAINSKESFAVNQFRRSKFFRYPTNFTETNAQDLLLDNPVYHLDESSLRPGMLNHNRFQFDTTAKLADYYVIRYFCKDCTNEKHGVGNYNQIADFFRGEGYEMGILTIERSNFAFRKIERTVLRNPGFSYECRLNTPNLVLPEKKYFMELRDGGLTAEYEPVNGKWYLKQLYHKYTNDFFRAQFGTKDYVITAFMEWRSDSTSRYTSDDFANKFYYKMPGLVYHYDSSFWAGNNFPFFFQNKDSVYRDIKRAGPLESQFYKESIKPKE